MAESSTHHIPGWERPSWAVRAVKVDTELTWERDSLIDVTVLEDVGVEKTYAPCLFRTDVVRVEGTAVAVLVGPCGSYPSDPGAWS